MSALPAKKECVDSPAPYFPGKHTDPSPPLFFSSLFINPDCGLKTRGWPETEAALVNLVNAAKWARAQYA